MEFPPSLHPTEAPNEAGVYALYDGDAIVYVGQTNSVRRRVAEHRKYRRVFDRIAFIQVSDWAERECLETYFIEKFRPKYNGVMYRTEEQRRRHREHNKNWRMKYPERVTRSTERVRRHRARKREMALSPAL